MTGKFPQVRVPIWIQTYVRHIVVIALASPETDVFCAAHTGSQCQLELERWSHGWHA